MQPYFVLMNGYLGLGSCHWGKLPQRPFSNMLQVWVPVNTFPSMLACGLQMILQITILLIVAGYIIPVICRRHALVAAVLVLKHLFLFSKWWSLRFKCGAFIICVPVENRCHTVTYSLNYDWLFFSVLVFYLLGKMHLW